MIHRSLIVGWFEKKSSLVALYISSKSVMMDFIFFQYCAVEFASLFFFFQAEDGIRDLTVTGVQTCALPIWASRLDLLGEDNKHVASDLRKAASGAALSPILLLRGDEEHPLIVADGYHRV